ncbi:AAA family ATPase, partial [Candidatus Poribacteria bacterium]|nr:AAA family ATPase [Candidatus Poribacteria bacterium]
RVYKSKAAHQFLLHFNIDDLIWDDIYGYLPTMDFLMEQMNRLGCDATLYYSRSEGIKFPNLGWRDSYQANMKLARIDEVELIPEDMPKYDRLNARFRRVGQEKLLRETQQAFVTLENFFRQGMGNIKVGLIIKDVEKISPNRDIMPLSDQIMDELIIDSETIQRWAADMDIRLRGHIILLLTENMTMVAPELSISDCRNTYPLRLPYPDYDQRLRFIRHMLNVPGDEEDENKYKLDLPENTKSEDLARMTHGLNIRDIHELWFTSKRRKTSVSVNLIVRQNQNSILARSYGRLNFIYGQHGLNTIGGLGEVTSYFKEIIQNMKNQEVKRVPRGILMVGPHGTGKTALIHALSREMGIHFLELKNLRGVTPQMRSDWDLHRALNIINSLQPVVVFIDNIDRIGQLTGSSEREHRITECLMSWLLETMDFPNLQGKVLWVAASNRPDMIRSEFRQRGRFDDVIPFLIPDSKDREDILKKLLSKNAIPYDNRINFSTVASGAKNCTGADLEVIIMRSYQNARKAERDTVTEQDIIKAVVDFIPAHDQDMYEYMMLLALREANLTPLVPQSLESGIQEKVYENNKVNMTKLNQRIRELSSNLRGRVRRNRR